VISVLAEKWNVMRQYWNQATKTGVIPDGLPILISESWARCKQNGTNPFLKANPYFASSDEMISRKRHRRELLNIASPIMENMAWMVKGSDYLIFIADQDGVILEVHGDELGLEFGKLSNHVVEACYDEKLLGTNAVGTALVTGKPIQVLGPHHWSIFCHKCNSTGAPIHDSSGDIIGCLNMVGSYTNAHQHTLGMVAAAVSAIEAQLRLKQESKYKYAIIETLTEGVMVLDGERKITHINKVAEKLFGVSSGEWSQAPFEKLTWKVPILEKLIQVIKKQLPINDELIEFRLNHSLLKCKLTVRYLPGGQKGTVLVFTENDRVDKLANFIGGEKSGLTFREIVGTHPATKAVTSLARKAALSSSRILLTGESGTGKEIFAQAIHNESYRSRFPFVAINCAAIPHELMGSELFGYVDGAFTGARKGGNPGKFESANGGTIFLDEIGEMPLDLQAHLLRFIEDKKITRLGGHEVIPVDVRIITATNRNLEEEVEKGNFRADLYYRLNVINLMLPPLRDRNSDIILLARHFAKEIGKNLGKSQVTIESKALLALRSYSWPGNIRELQNTIERALNLFSGNTLKLEHLPPHIAKAIFQSLSPDISDASMKEVEMNTIVNALKMHRGNRKRAAEELGISRTTLYRKLDEFGLQS
jgi:transcriptional regulator of acetoin/glycerol metabolism